MKLVGILMAFYFRLSSARHPLKNELGFLGIQFVPGQSKIEGELSLTILLPARAWSMSLEKISGRASVLRK